ncbi:MAG: transketolase C-terminal domain-containing protein [bacterium]|nr:transketolase C-terminal domain-containing protein [bacterium]
MRKQLVQTVESLLAKDERLVVLLGDISVFGFRKAFEMFPKRIYNIGILEQSTIGMAAGLAIENFIPVVHTIAPFIAERSFEQLKDDFGYQKLGGNFVSIGASYDYAALGCTHHCPGDVGILKNIPGMEIILPGTAAEFDILFRQSYGNGHPTYYRLSEKENAETQPVQFGKANVLKRGKLATVIAVGSTITAVLEACKKEDVTILYYTTVEPFDKKTLRNNCPSGKVLLCEPYYEGGLTNEIVSALKPRPVSVETVGVPRQFLTNYGKAEEHDEHIEITGPSIRKRLKKLIR